MDLAMDGETRVGVELRVAVFRATGTQLCKNRATRPLLHYSTHSSFLLSSRIREVDVTLQFPSAHP